MAATPNGLDYFKNGEASRCASGKNSSTGLDYFKCGELFRGVSVVAGVGGNGIVKQVILAFQRVNQ